ncbi:MAG: hypothetical protein IIX45_05050 [Lachnospiraceae bacterium]|nr:hypothetical protein [Lachnospiraceae bacterium]
MKKYLSLREQYKTFKYNSFNIEEENSDIKITYDFEIEGLSRFTPAWRFSAVGHNVEELKKNGTFMNMAFSLGMVELISYWKICCPKNVLVYGYKLSNDQIKWWKELYYLGLGEYFYTNGIKADADDFMDIISLGNDMTLKEYPLNNNKGCLVPVGGGKDSVVTLELLKKAGEDISCYIINPRGATLNTVAVAGLKEKLIVAKRTLDKNMIELNKQGFLNGHTPYSAIVAFSSTIAAYLNNLKYITLSNEDSANESTVKGSSVNHQYSKSFKFECDFHNYESEYIKSNTSYFSLLRPLSEFQIAGYFSKQIKYHDIFRSCNVGSKEDIWCGHCPKCLFVYLILSPFLTHERLNEIFGNDMVNDMSMKEDFDKLIGMMEEKPFECVGSRDEVNTAVCMTISKYGDSLEELPEMFKYYMTTPFYSEYKDKECTIFGKFNEENLLPEKFREIVYKSFVQ